MKKQTKAKANKTEVKTKVVELKAIEVKEKPLPPLFTGSGMNFNPFTMPEGAGTLGIFTKLPAKTEDIAELIIRSEFPAKRTGAHVEGVSFANGLTWCEEFKYDEGAMELRNILASLPAHDGHRMELVTDAVIGERRQQRETSGGVGNWLRKANPFGNKDDKGKD